jgi:hypothetical protein
MRRRDMRRSFCRYGAGGFGPVEVVWRPERWVARGFYQTAPLPGFVSILRAAGRTGPIHCKEASS